MSLFSNWTVGRRLVAGFGLSALTLVAVAVVSYRNASLFIENDGCVAHSHQVRTELADLLSELKDAETAQRGFLLTADESYLEPYKVALGAIQSTFGNLHKLTADNPDQQRRLAGLSQPVDKKLAELRQTIDLRRTQGLDAALKVVVTNVGKIYMDDARAIVADADQEERDLLKKRPEEARASPDMTQIIILWGGLLGTSAVCAIGWLITRSLSQQIGSAVGQGRRPSPQVSGAKEQATAMAEISTTISELLATSRQIAESAQRVAHNAEETANAARSGHGTVDMTHESISSIRRQVDQIVSHMLELGKKSQEIGAVLEIVSELAEKTNILAING